MSVYAQPNQHQLGQDKDEREVKKDAQTLRRKDRKAPVLGAKVTGAGDDGD